MKISPPLSGHYDRAAQTLHLKGQGRSGARHVELPVPDVGAFLSSVVAALQIGNGGVIIERNAVSASQIGMDVHVMEDGSSAMIISLKLGDQTVRYGLNLGDATGQELRDLATQIAEVGKTISALQDRIPKQ